MLDKLFETREQVEAVVRPGVVLKLRPHPSTEEIWYLVRHPPTFSTSMGRLTVHLLGTRLTARGTKHHPRPKDVIVVLLSEIKGIEVR